MNHPNDEDPPPLALSNEAAQPVRDPQPKSSVDAALGNAFTSRGMINLGRYDYERDYLARNRLIHVGNFRRVAPSFDNDSWRRATGYKGWNPMLANDAEDTQGG